MLSLGSQSFLVCPSVFVWRDLCLNLLPMTFWAMTKWPVFPGGGLIFAYSLCRSFWLGVFSATPWNLSTLKVSCQNTPLEPNLFSILICPQFHISKLQGDAILLYGAQHHLRWRWAATHMNPWWGKHRHILGILATHLWCQYFSMQQSNRWEHDNHQ